MLYCDLCHKYLPRIENGKDIETLLREHCLMTGHQNAYFKKQNELLGEQPQCSTDIQNHQQVFLFLDAMYSWNFFVTGFYSHGSFYIEMYNILQTTTTLPYRTDEDQHEDQLDFEAEDSISAADTSSIVDEECWAM